MTRTPRIVYLTGLVGVALVSPAARAQLATPAVPFPAAGAAVAPGAAVGAAPAAAPTTLWSFFGLSKANLAACKAELCQKPIGQMLNNGLMTFGAMSGGLIHPLCPTVPSAADVAALEAQSGPNGAEAVAAKIKQDEADAKARVAAVEYLATVDCRYWKEAKVALLNALRADRNECVRFAAAKALAGGCCCSKETIEALRIVVAGEDSDGYPAELSARVKAWAFIALQNCLLKVPDTVPAVEPEPAPPPPAVRPEPSAAAPSGPDGAHLVAGASPTAPTSPTPSSKPPAPPQPLALEQRLQRKPLNQVIGEARATLVRTAQSPPRVSYMLTGERSLFQTVAKARRDYRYQSYARNNVAAGPGRDPSGGAVPPAPVVNSPGAASVSAPEPKVAEDPARDPGVARASRFSISQFLSRSRSRSAER